MKIEQHKKNHSAWLVYDSAGQLVGGFAHHTGKARDIYRDEFTYYSRSSGGRRLSAPSLEEARRRACEGVL